MGAPDQSRSQPPLPLDGVRILAFEQFGAGPWATMQLLDLGAEVIKVEDPRSGGDVSRYIPPFQEGEDSLFFQTFNRGKKSISLDLREEAGRAVLPDLVKAVDIVFCNLRGDYPHRLGLTYEQLRGYNEAVVCCSLSGFGMSGPRAGEGTYDNVIQGLAGWMSMTGGPSAPPTKSGLSLVDFTGGYVAALAMLGALHRARTEGIGAQCDISLQETAISLLNYNATWALSNGYVAERRPDSGHPSIVPFQAIPTADGWITVACAKEKFWLALCECIGRPDLAVDERFETFAVRDINRDELVRELYEIFKGRPSAEWLGMLAKAGVPSGPVNDLRQALEDPQIKARDGIAIVDHPTLGAISHVRSPLRIDERTAPLSLAPSRGADTGEILSELCGYGPERVQKYLDALDS
jgi:crotonobetainyl-CoA:carnitine CoA-transferase CaiB-like acyl-CoA transferase